MTAGGPNIPPNSDWSVLYDEALLRWLDTRPAEGQVDAFVQWVDYIRNSGPPAAAVRIYEDDDLYVAIVPGTELEGISVSVEFRLVVDDRERLILVRDIG